MFFGMVSFAVDDLCRSLAGDGVMEFILYHGVELFCGRRIAIVVDAALGKNIRHLLPDTAFAGADRADALQ